MLQNITLNYVKQYTIRRISCSIPGGAFLVSYKKKCDDNIYVTYEILLEGQYLRDGAIIEDIGPYARKCNRLPNGELFLYNDDGALNLDDILIGDSVY